MIRFAGSRVSFVAGETCLDGWIKGMDGERAERRTTYLNRYILTMTASACGHLEKAFS